MIRINLLPKSARRRRGPQAGGMLAVGGAFLVLVGLSYAWWAVRSDITHVRHQITTATAELRKYEAIAKEVESLKKVRKRLEDRLLAINRLVASQEGPVKLLDLVSARLPDNVWLTTMTQNGRQVVIQGFAFSDYSIANFMTKLGRGNPVVTNVELSFTERVEINRVPLKRFEMVCEVAS